MKPPLREHQSRAINYALKNPYSILALDPGLGKTRCAIEVRDRLKAKCLVICPSYLILNWVKEINLWARPGVRSLAVRSGKLIPQTPAANFIIISYDLVQKAPHLFEWADMVVLDEAHAIKSMKAKRTEFIHRHVYENSVKRVHLLTGTPIKNRAQEFYSLLALCFYNPSAADSRFLDLYPSEIDFADRFSFRDDFTVEINGREIKVMRWKGIQRVPELKTHLKDKYIRIRSSDVLDLPPVIHKEFHISDHDDPELIEAFNSYFDDSPDNDRKDRTGSVLPEHKAQAALKKVPFTIKYAQDLLEEVECLLIYSDHVAPAEAIAEAMGVTAITGKVPADRRSKMADEFQAGKGKVLVATVGSMKEGKDLYRASHIVFNDFPWVPGDLKQVIYRIQRIGQKSHCTIHKMIGSPQDGQIIKTLEDKLKVIETASE